MSRQPNWSDHPEIDQSEQVELNLTPLVDVVFALLIVFMISSAAIIEEGRVDAATGQVDLSLPSGQSAAQAMQSAEVIVQIEADGNLFEDGKPTDMHALNKNLVQKLRANPELQVRIEADEKLTYQRVMEIITGLQELGLKNVGLATRQPTQ